MWRKVSLPPPEYLDGCTMAPDRFGAVYHGDICTDHDLDYWQKRRFTDKWVADWLWACRIVERHARNGLWIVPAIGLAVVGWIALSSVGWIPWMRRHRFDE